MSSNRERNYEIARDKAIAALRDMVPQLVAYRSGVVYQASGIGAGGMETGEFILPFWDEEYAIKWPEGKVRELSSRRSPLITTQILLLHYLITADGIPLADRWIAFREFPDGLIYDGAFQARSGDRIAAAFGHDKERFIRAGHALGGVRLTYGDASFMFRLLPRLPVAVILHLADEEFLAAASVLFDATAEHYLDIEDLAVLGGIVASRLIKAGT